MILSRGLTRFGLVAAAAALMLTLSMAVAGGTANAQTPPAVFYGKGLKTGDRVEGFIGGKSCGAATVNAAGEWSIQIAADAACGPTAGASVSFTLNGGAAVVTPAPVWAGGGLPPDVANGYVLAMGVAQPTATAAPVTPPKTGNAGMLGTGAGSTSPFVVLAIGLIALGAVAGTRAYSGRRG